MSETTSFSKSKNITLVLTHACNLSCVYCYEHNKNAQTMTLDAAKEIIDRELTMEDGTTSVEFDFFGGEPLLEFETVKAAVEYTKSKTYPKEYIFFITTNGVLLDETNKAWLEANADVLQLGLSLDGNKTMHDLNRCNSFDKLDLGFFRRVYPDQNVKMTVSLQTLPMLAEGVIFCHEQGFEVACNLAYGIDWEEPANRTVFEEQLFRLIQYYLEHPEIKPCTLLDITMIKSVSLPDEKSYRHCGAGFAMKAYDCDGVCYPCQFFLPISVGEEKAKRSLDFDFSSYQLKENQVDENCRGCMLRNVCPTCYGNNYASTGDIYRRDMRICEMNKIQFKAIAYFATKRFENGQMGDIPNADAALILKAALEILETF